MSRPHGLFLVNAIFVALAALPLIFAYPAASAMLDHSWDIAKMTAPLRKRCAE